MKKVKNKEIAIKTWFGGVCWVPKAWRRIDITIIILVKLVIPNTNEGRTVRAVINSRICKGNEYSVVLPLVDTFNAGKPEDIVSPKAWTGNPLIKKIVTRKDIILEKFLNLLRISSLLV